MDSSMDSVTETTHVTMMQTAPENVETSTQPIVEAVGDVHDENRVSFTATATTEDAAGGVVASSQQPKKNVPGTLVREQLKFCGTMLRNLKRHKDAFPFLVPVDPVALNIPDYFKVIKTPMDLGSIHKKLEQCQYETAEQFIDDVRLVFSNCFTYNTPDSVVHKMGRNLEKAFENQLLKMPQDVPAPFPDDVMTSTPRPDNRKRKASQLDATPAGAVIAPLSTSVAASPAPSPMAAMQRSYKKNIQAEHLRFCGLVYRELTKKAHETYVWPFMTPVDPILLNIPDYFDVIKNPMDLSTMKRKMDEKIYQTIDEFHADFELMCNNCYTYNPPNSDVVAMCRKMHQAFKDKWAERPVFVDRLPGELPESALTATPAPSVRKQSSAVMGSVSLSRQHSTVRDEDLDDDSSDDDSLSIKMLRQQRDLIDQQLAILMEKRENRRRAKLVATGLLTPSELIRKKSKTGTAAHSHQKRSSMPILSPGQVAATPTPGASKRPASNKPRSKQPSTSSFTTGSAPATTLAVNEPSPLTFQEKHYLSEAINDLTQDQLPQVIRIIQEGMPNLANNSDEIELDIDSLNAQTQQALMAYVVSIKGAPPSTQQAADDDSSESDSSDEESNPSPHTTNATSAVANASQPVQVADLDAWSSLAASAVPITTPPTVMRMDSHGGASGASPENNGSAADSAWSAFQSNAMLQKQREKERQALEEQLRKEADERARQSAALSAQKAMEAARAEQEARRHAEQETERARLREEEELQARREAARRERLAADAEVDLQAQSHLMLSFEREMRRSQAVVANGGRHSPEHKKQKVTEASPTRATPVATAEADFDMNDFGYGSLVPKK